jgi:hypothetical protein
MAVMLGVRIQERFMDAFFQDYRYRALFRILASSPFRGVDLHGFFFELQQQQQTKKKENI